VRNRYRDKGLRSAVVREEARGGGEDELSEEVRGRFNASEQERQGDLHSQAADKKLAGAAKDSFVKKCIADAG